MQNENYAIEMVNITKKFPGIIANDNVSAMVVRSSKQGVYVKIVGRDGSVKHEKT